VKITIAEFAELDLAGRRFRAREGRRRLRGVVRASNVCGDLVTIAVGDVEVQDGSAWTAFADFDYAGREEITSIRRQADGALSISILYIGAIEIFPVAPAG